MLFGNLLRDHWDAIAGRTAITMEDGRSLQRAGPNVVPQRRTSKASRGIQRTAQLDPFERCPI
jgi:hypothetical protein